MACAIYTVSRGSRGSEGNAVLSLTPTQPFGVMVQNIYGEFMLNIRPYSLADVLM